MTSDPWAEFSRDPRRVEHASLRAGDADRDVVARVLGEAYAEGRLDHEELDDRTTRLQSARTLGELPAFLEDLVPASPTTSSHAPLAIEQRALEKWRRDRREALWGFISVSAIVWTIWLVTSGVGSFPWPAFVTLAALLNVGRTQVQRDDIVADERRRLEKKERKALERDPDDEDQA
ncbi:hypothetical protein GCM10009623_37390 [Nocardioides aestuarii]|uniref:DUF1707 domain-containing protein n=1 Tax=Nocardioides aestuarii TaxID=252231 RepID=A0ABW4TSH0_9ACTN